MMKVAMIMGSDSDWPVLRPGYELLKSFGVACDVMVMSAHRTPEAVASFASTARENGYGVVIAAAGMAAHLAGVVAAHTTLPIIGIPVMAKALDGLDALLATVQMPPGVPVATVGINAAKNAALLAVQMLSIHDSDLAGKLSQQKIKMAQEVTHKNQALQDELARE